MKADSVTAITFPQYYSLDERSIKLVRGAVGLYFISLTTLKIPYPFLESGLIYIGMSESRHNSIGEDSARISPSSRETLPSEITRSVTPQGSPTTHSSFCGTLGAPSLYEIAAPRINA
jgi:hypothetical protein